MQKYKVVFNPAFLSGSWKPKGEMAISKKLLFSIFLFILSGMYSMYAQTCTCTQRISVSNANNYTVTVGQVLCVDSGKVASGKISIKGGTLCINGSVIGTITDGTTLGTYTNGGSIIINKYGGLIYIGDLSIGKLKVTVNSKGTFNVLGALTLPGAGSSVINSGVINVKGTITLKPSSALDNKWIINAGAVYNNGITITGGGKLNTTTN